jgi:tetratricopeptide (TPR) repeat protein
VQNICKTQPFPQSLEWFNKAQDYIKKSITGLADSQPPKPPKGQPVVVKPPEVVLIDEAASAKAYQDGLVAYAQGRLFDARKSWEVAIRYNPKNKQAQNALDRIKTEIEKTGGKK